MTLRGRTPGEPDQDRWARRDWWGVVLDATDVARLVRFYSELTGWPVWRAQGRADGQTDGQAGEGSALDLREGVGYLSVQHDPGYVRPVWPPAEGAQRMMLHLDFQVDDLDAAVAHAVELGAHLPDFQPQADVRVLLDPDGHPFCLYT